MTNDFENFKLALKNNNKKLFDKVEKGDLHNHALLGSNRRIFQSIFPNESLEKFTNNNNILSLSMFIKNNILHISTTRKGQLSLFECTILTAINDGITYLEISVDYRLVFEVYDNQYKNYIKDLLILKKKYASKINLKYDLGISRNAYNPIHENIILKLIDSNIFNGIDIYGDELSKPINTFKNIFRYAEKSNLKLKAHVGEFGTAKDIYEAIKTLHLNVIQHGISIIDDINVMKYAKNKNIQFNICPISNLKLCRINNITEHPIKKMYDYGLKVTINTDDQLIFENSLFDEYKLLYDNDVFSIEQLNEIRKNSVF